SLDILTGEETAEFTAPRVDTINDHGTGCTLSAAIAALVPRYGYVEAVRRAKEYLTAALRHADELDVGSGHGPVHHFHALWDHTTQKVQSCLIPPRPVLATSCASKTTTPGKRPLAIGLCTSFSMPPSPTQSWPATWCKTIASSIASCCFWDPLWPALILWSHACGFRSLSARLPAMKIPISYMPFPRSGSLRNNGTKSSIHSR